MKNFSIAVRILVLASGVCCVSAQAAEPVTAPSARCEFLANAPDQHVVVKGDTLWGISGRFLQHPWCWPQVWGLNREQIRNPHWIYPGQTIVFDRASGKLRIAQAGGHAGDIPEVRLSPQTRVQALEGAGIASIPPAAIEPFLSQVMLVEPATLATAPRVVATDEGHISAGRGENVYASGQLNGLTDFQVFKQAVPLVDPVTREVLGLEAAYLGTVRLTRAARTAGEAHRLIITSSKEEIGAGAFLIPVPPSAIMNYAPHPPSAAVDARVVSIYGGIGHAGRNNIVAINRGARDGIDAGTVLQLTRLGRVVRDIAPVSAAAGNGATPGLIRIPDENYGMMFVFRVFDRVSYGLIMQVSDAVRVNDLVRSPE